MSRLSQGLGLRQKHKVKHKLSHELRQLHDLTLLHRHELRQRIAQELSQNPALEIVEEPTLLEDLEPEERDDDWNEDYDKSGEEYETGEPSVSKDASTWDAYDVALSLEQVALQIFRGKPELLKHALLCVDYYTTHGYLPEDAAPQLHDDLAKLETSLSYSILPSLYPTFEVAVEDNRVEAYAFPEGLNLRYVRGVRKLSSGARKFIKLLQDRNNLLNNVGHHILSKIQGDFFLQDDLDKALHHLIPVAIGEVGELISSPFSLDKKYFSKLGDHLVSCHLGMLSLNSFLQGAPAIIRIWVGFARREGILTKKAQCDWIRNQIDARVREWSSEDLRHEFIAPLKEINEEKIKNAFRGDKNAFITKDGAFGWVS